MLPENIAMQDSVDLIIVIRVCHRFCWPCTCMNQSINQSVDNQSTSHPITCGL